MKTLAELGEAIVLSGPFFFILLYAILAVIIIIIARKMGRNRGKKAWGRKTALLIFLFVFWDTPIVLGTLHYQCNHQAGFTVYTPLDEWKQANPGVAETLVPIKNARSTKQGNTTRYQLNQRFAWDITKTTVPILDITQRVEQITDTKTHAVLAEYIDFDSIRLHSADYSFVNPPNPHSLKFWLARGSCPRTEDKTKWLVNGDSFISFQNKIENINGDEQ